MQMIDLMKRLAELDAQNPNVVQEAEFRRPETDHFKSRERNAKFDTRNQVDTGTWYIRINGKIMKKNGEPSKFNGKAHAQSVANKLIANPANDGKKIFLTMKPVDDGQLGEADGSDGTFNGHKIVANRKTAKGDFLVIQNKNDGSYEIHKNVGMGQSTTGYEFVSAHKTPEEMQAAFKNLTGVDEGMVEGGSPDNELRSDILSVLETIKAGAEAGEDMIDNVADELGDYFSDVKHSKDKTLRQAYQLMSQKGAEAEDNPEMMAQIAQQAIDMLSQPGGLGGLNECGMMDSMGSMSQPHTPASINMTAASGEELSGMLKDIMSLAGMSKDSEMPVSTEPAAQTLEPAGPPEMDSTTIMRSVIDKMNPDDDEEETDEAWDNEPNPETAGYDSMTPSGDDLHKEKAQYPAAQPGDNAMTMEQQLMAEYKKFINEAHLSESGRQSFVILDPSLIDKIEQMVGTAVDQDEDYAIVWSHNPNTTEKLMSFAKNNPTRLKISNWMASNPRDAQPTGDNWSQDNVTLSESRNKRKSKI